MAEFSPDLKNGPAKLIDSHGRTMRDLRVSVTDRCNFRCMYCLPETEAAENFYRGRWANFTKGVPIARVWQPHSHILTFEEIERTVRLAVDLGIEKIRLTGGEPMLRQQLEKLVEKIAKIPGITDIAMTTNGMLFRQKAKALRDAGLRRISFSMDSLDRDNFKKITGRDALQEVLESIDQAIEIGLNPVKVNAVVIRDVNDHEIESLADFARKKGIIFRFIEFMPLDSGHAWKNDLVVKGQEILQRLQTHFSKGANGSSLVPIVSENKSETARRWKFADGPGEIGIIAPVSEPFCGHCNRIRLTADGKLRTCLFSVVEHDLRVLLRGGASDEAVQQFFIDAVRQKESGHRIGQADFKQPERTMSCIGG